MELRDWFDLLAEATDCLLVLDDAGAVLDATGSAQALFGVAASDLVGCSLPDLLPGFSGSGTAKTKQGAAVHVRMHTAGERTLLLCRSVPKNEGNLMQALIDALPVPAFFKSADSVYRRCNQGMTKYFGRTVAEIVGKHAFDLTAPEHAAKYHRMDQELLAQGLGGRQVYEYLTVAADDGSVHQCVFHKSVMLDPSSGELGIFGVVFDVTERNMLQRELLLLTGRLQDAIDSIPEGFALYDADDRIALCNQRFIEFYPTFGSVERTIGRSFEELVDSLLAEGAILGEASEDFRRRRVWRHRYPGGEPFFYHLADDRWISISERRTKEGGTVAIYTEVTELKRREQHLEQSRRSIEALAHHDPLTGLPNRLVLRERLAEVMAAKRWVALIYLDLDGFKAVNDTYGHAAGDALLKVIARRLAGCVRDGDLVARMGGDEFVVLMPADSKAPRRRAAQVAQRILAAVAAPVSMSAGETAVGCSLGIAVWPEDAAEGEALLAAADAALYDAKRCGKNRAVFFAPETPTSV